MNQLHLLQQALPRIHATESLQHHLQCAGIEVGCMIEVNEDGVCALLLVTAPYRIVLNVIEHAGLDARPVAESRSSLLDVRSYEAEVFGHTVTIVIQTPTEALPSRFSSWLQDYRDWLDAYRRQASHFNHQGVQTHAID